MIGMAREIFLPVPLAYYVLGTDELVGWIRFPVCMQCGVHYVHYEGGASTSSHHRVKKVGHHRVKKVG